MNLYKIQEELKFKSIPELQRFANGMDPSVPAWMASAVLKAKVDEKQRWDNMQGAARGQMPSIKEQLEQKAALMQQQASQTPMGLAQAAMPAPKGPVQMPGGITSGNAGADMTFAEGGIVGFADGGKGDKYETEYDRNRRLEREAGTGGLEPMLRYIRAPLDAAADVARLPVSLWEHMMYTGKGESPSWTPAMDERTRYLESLKDSPTAVQARNERAAAEPVPTENVAGSRRTPQQLAAAGINPVVAPAGGLGEGKNLAPTGPRPPAAPPAGGLGSSSVAAMLQKQLGKEPAQPTTDDAIAAIKGIQKGFGVAQPAGAEERAMIEEMKRRYAQGQEDRAMRNLQGVLSAFGRGYGAAGLESARQSEAATAADLAQQQKVYEMINAINKANRAEGVGAAKSAGELLSGREKTAGEADRARLQALANVYHTNVASAAQLEASRIMAAARSGQMDEKQQLAELKALQASLQAQLKGMNQFDKAGRAPYEQQLQIVNAEIAKMAGLSTMPGAPGAASAGGTPPPGAVRLKQ